MAVQMQATYFEEPKACFSEEAIAGGKIECLYESLVICVVSSLVQYMARCLLGQRAVLLLQSAREYRMER